jgi:hypothetical protein
MTKVATMTIPPDFQALLDKILAHFDQMIYPTWATRFFHRTRAAKKANEEKTYLPHIHDIWSVMTPAEKQAWKDAKGYTGYSGYQVFTADYSYRRKNNLTIPGTAYTTHQLYGLKISNPGGGDLIRVRLHLKDLTGPLTIAFNYKKGQYALPADKSFNFTAQAFYFDGGLNIVDTKEWESPTGDVAWAVVSQSWGTSGKKYFHLTIEFKLDNYDADVFLDNLRITDGNGAFYSDSFNKKVGKEWIYTPFYRKQGWAFDPSFAVPNFEIVYLD